MMIKTDLSTALVALIFLSNQITYEKAESNNCKLYWFHMKLFTNDNAEGIALERWYEKLTQSKEDTDT